MYTANIFPDDTIVAPATANGIAALGVIRVSGKNAFKIVNQVFKGKDLQNQATHTIHYGHIVDGEELIDEVLVSVFIGPRSFTAEDSIEISCHGSPYIQRQIVELLSRHGARLAEPGEFSMRAYLNGRLDLAQAEAIGDIIASQNRSQLDLALKQMRGGLSKHLQILRVGLLDFISLIELELDFGEEDVEFADRSKLRQQVYDLMAAIHPILDSFKYGNAIKNGIPVAIVGRPNAGKSSLLNALLSEERAIVSDIAGTTRDTIEEEIHIEGVSFRFIDTAGIRSTEDKIEKIGIEKALKKITEASIILYIYDLFTITYEELQSDLDMLKSKNQQAQILVLGNKLDQVSNIELDKLGSFINEQSLTYHYEISLNQAKHTDLQGLRKMLWDMAQLNQNSSNTIITNTRHYNCLKDAIEALEQVLGLMDQSASSDLLAFELKRAVYAIGDITGQISNDEVLGNIFGKFCIGK
jgi:tRNA modification GTPase